jgi:hypothetical protein
MRENPISYIIQSVSDIEGVINANVLLLEKSEICRSSVVLASSMSAFLPLRFTTIYSDMFQPKY